MPRHDIEDGGEIAAQMLSYLHSYALGESAPDMGDESKSETAWRWLRREVRAGSAAARVAKDRERYAREEYEAGRRGILREFAPLLAAAESKPVRGGARTKAVKRVKRERRRALQSHAGSFGARVSAIRADVREARPYRELTLLLKMVNDGRPQSPGIERVEASMPLDPADPLGVLFGEHGKSTLWAFFRQECKAFADLYAQNKGSAWFIEYIELA